MRPWEKKRIRKPKTKPKTNKKNAGRTRNKSWGFGGNITMEKLDRINESLRIGKTQECQGWKVLPKDSIEILKKARRRRKMKDKRYTSSDEESMDEDESIRSRNNDRKRRQNNRKGTKRSGRTSSQKNNRNKKRDISESSYTSSS